jgi:hypothetical protein
MATAGTCAGWHREAHKRSILARPRPVRSRELGYRRDVPDEPSTGQERVHTAELVAALCLATDLAMGFPFEHGLHATQVAMRLGDRVGIDAGTASDTYYACLLSYCGCTADAEIAAEIFGGDLRAHVVPVLFGSRREMLAGILRALAPPDNPAPARAVEVVRRLPRAARGNKPHQRALCEVGEMLAGRLGLPESVQTLFVYLTERWDGKGVLGRAKREEIPLALRIAQVARDAAFQQLLGGPEHAARVVRERAGGAFDPEIAACATDNAPELLTLDPGPSAWEQTLARELHPPLALEAEAIDRALAAMGDFADLISPYLVGHSAGRPGDRRQLVIVDEDGPAGTHEPAEVSEADEDGLVAVVAVDQGEVEAPTRLQQPREDELGFLAVELDQIPQSRSFEGVQAAVAEAALLKGVDGDVSNGRLPGSEQALADEQAGDRIAEADFDRRPGFLSLDPVAQRRALARTDGDGKDVVHGSVGTGDHGLLLEEPREHLLRLPQPVPL